MIKSRFFWSVGLICFFLFASVVCASIDSQISDTANSVDKSIQNVDKLVSSSDARSSYLKEEWLKIVQSKPFGQYVLPVHNFLIANKQIFALVLGIEYQISWKFFLALFFWIFLVIVFSGWLAGLVILFILFVIYVSSIFGGKSRRQDRVYNFVNHSKNYGLGFFRVVFFVVIVFLLSIFRLPLGLANIVSGIFSSETDFVMRIVYGAVGIFIIVIINRVGKLFKNKYKDFKKQVGDAEIRSLSERIKNVNESDENARAEEATKAALATAKQGEIKGKGGGAISPETIEKVEYLAKMADKVEEAIEDAQKKNSKEYLLSKARKVKKKDLKERGIE